MPRTFAEEWNTCKLLESCLPNASDEERYKAFWELDERMRAVVDPIVEQYKQGTIHSMEFIFKLSQEVNDIKRNA